MALLLGLWNPYLVTAGWHLFWGIGLVISLAPIAFFPDGADPAPITANSEVRESFPWIWVIFCRLVIALNCVPFGDIPGKPIKVLIDESHSKWEPTAIKPEERSLPTLAENNYSAWLSYIESIVSVTISVVRNSSEPFLIQTARKIEKISPELLNGIEILIVKCPTLAFDASERQTIMSFVENGGTLWEIGEHTDVFHINTCINELRV